MIERGAVGGDPAGCTFNALRSVARFAVEVKILPESRRTCRCPRVGKRVPTAPLPCDVAAVIDAARYAGAPARASCSRHTRGCARARSAALRCGDCELDRNRLVVRVSRWKAHTGTPEVGPRARGAADAATAGGPARGGRRQATARGVCGARRRRASRGAATGPTRRSRRTLRRLNLPRERLHALRAFFVTTLLNGHVPAHVVRELVGHGDRRRDRR